MEAVMAGRIQRAVAHNIVVPWVEGDEETFEVGVLGGASILHGLDLITDDAPGSLRHAPDESRNFLFDDEEVRERCTEWISRWVLGDTEIEDQKYKISDLSGGI